MSYYEYDPNCDYYYYDEYPNFDFYVEEPVIDYRPQRRKKRRERYPVANKSLDRTLPDDDCSYPYQQHKSKYLVPVFYAPTKTSDTHKLNPNIQENIDLYYSDRRNIEKEARLFRKHAQPSYYASTIQEETESSTCVESCGLKEDLEHLQHGKSAVLDQKTNVEDVPEKWHEYSYKAPKAKKKSKGCQSIATDSNRKQNSKYKSDKLENSNSWTTLLSGSCNTNKDFKISEGKKSSNEAMGVNLPIKESKSVISVHGRSKTPVKFHVKCDDSMKDVNQTAQSELQAERDTDKSSTEENMKNQSYKSVSNVQSMAMPHNQDTTEMVGWKNTMMQQDSSTTATSKITSSQEIKSDPILADSCDSTDVTINTAEYKEFLKSMNNSSKTQKIPFHRYPNYNNSIDTITENSGDMQYIVPVNSTVSNDTFCDQIVYAKRMEEHKRHFKRRVNPLLDVPLNFSKHTLYTPTFLLCEQPKPQHEENQPSIVTKPRSLFVRMFRSIAEFVACFQNYAYKYVLRFILFI